MKRIALTLLAVLCLMLPSLAVATESGGRRDNWGAIAYSYATGRYGFAYDYPSQAAAINSAVERCRADDCKAVVWFVNSCGSFAQGTNAYGWGIGNSRAAAEERALAECRKRGGGCRVIAWACTTR